MRSTRKLDDFSGVGKKGQSWAWSSWFLYAIHWAHCDKMETRGNQFTPKGNPGRANDYPTEKGVFTVPLHEFCEIFGDLSVETNQAHNGKKR